MKYKSLYRSPLGKLLLIADETHLTGLRLGYQLAEMQIDVSEDESPVLEQAKKWLDIYFSGREPDFMPPLRLAGSDFQMAVWQILCTIPYGETVTYGEIAEQIARQRGITRMSAQSVGGAVGRNPVSIMVPCHRVIGANGNLTGYAGGLDKKIALLQLEKSALQQG